MLCKGKKKKINILAFKLRREISQNRLNYSNYVKSHPTLKRLDKPRVDWTKETSFPPDALPLCDAFFRLTLTLNIDNTALIFHEEWEKE